MIRKNIFFVVIVFYFCSFVSANAVEKISIKALPLYLLLGATQLFDTIGKPLADNIHITSSAVTTNITNTTTNIISEILKKLVILQKDIQRETNIRASQINNINKDIGVLFINDNFYYTENKSLRANYISVKSQVCVAMVISGVLLLLICCNLFKKT